MKQDESAGKNNAEETSSGAVGYLHGDISARVIVGTSQVQAVCCKRSYFAEK